jgi:hypothetical protein
VDERALLLVLGQDMVGLPQSVGAPGAQGHNVQALLLGQAEVARRQGQPGIEVHLLQADRGRAAAELHVRQLDAQPRTRNRAATFMPGYLIGITQPVKIEMIVANF